MHGTINIKNIFFFPVYILLCCISFLQQNWILIVTYTSVVPSDLLTSYFLAEILYALLISPSLLHVHSVSSRFNRPDNKLKNKSCVTRYTLSLLCYSPSLSCRYYHVVTTFMFQVLLPAWNFG